MAPKIHCHGRHCSNDQKDDDETQEPQFAFATKNNTLEITSWWFEPPICKILL